MSKLERTVRIRQCRGEVHPRLIFDSPYVIARHDSAETIPGDSRASLAMTIEVGGLAITGSFWE